MATVGYARVSTGDQTMAMQTDALEAAGCDRIFRERGRSGADRDRPELGKALAALQPRDTLVVWRLDRVARSVRHLTEIVEDLNERGVAFRSCTESIDTSSASGRLLVHVLAAVAEFEREAIRERVTAGIAAARRRGTRLGRPRALNRDQRDLVIERRSAGVGPTQLARELGVSRSTIHRALGQD